MRRDCCADVAASSLLGVDAGRVLTRSSSTPDGTPNPFTNWHRTSCGWVRSPTYRDMSTTPRANKLLSRMSWSHSCRRNSSLAVARYSKSCVGSCSVDHCASGPPRFTGFVAPSLRMRLMRVSLMNGSLLPGSLGVDKSNPRTTVTTMVPRVPGSVAAASKPSPAPLPAPTPPPAAAVRDKMLNRLGLCLESCLRSTSRLARRARSRTKNRRTARCNTNTLMKLAEPPLTDPRRASVANENGCTTVRRRADDDDDGVAGDDADAAAAPTDRAPGDTTP